MLGCFDNVLVTCWLHLHLGCSPVLVTISEQVRPSPWQHPCYSTLESSG
jgi:hypothetical protein